MPLLSNKYCKIIGKNYSKIVTSLGETSTVCHVCIRLNSFRGNQRQRTAQLTVVEVHSKRMNHFRIESHRDLRLLLHMLHVTVKVVLSLRAYCTIYEINSRSSASIAPWDFLILPYFDLFIFLFSVGILLCLVCLFGVQ